jgi:demethylmenaquinone methyltransferase/2-methoxy-6-polyprenyl-1,4-benzoquinol methylase
VKPHPVLAHRYGSEEDKPAFVQSLFDAGAPYYDRVTGWGFLGTGKAYRRMAQNRAGVGPGLKVLDCAAGTGVMAEAAMRLGVSADDILCSDVSPEMLEVAKSKLSVRTLVASADSLPLEDGQFDFVTMGFALRHVASLETTFAEYFRVLRPGGRVLILEITIPENRFARGCFRLYFRDIYPALTRLFTGSRAARDMMRYYWETMEAVVPPESILEVLRSTGFTEVKRNVVGGVCSEYTARKAS